MVELRLTIKDLALLKSNPKQYYSEKTAKTHDGTSMGKIGPAIDKWVQNSYRRQAIFDENGKLLDDVDITERGWNDSNFLWKDYADTSSKNLNYVQVDNNHFGYFQEEENDLGCKPLYDGDMKRLATEKNKDGEYLLRSYSVVGPNGVRMTAIRGDKFTEEDEQAFKRACDKYDKIQRLYRREYYTTRGRVNDGVTPEQVIAEIGTFQQRLEDKGIIKEIEDCHCKIRWSKKNYGKIPTE